MHKLWVYACLRSGNRRHLVFTALPEVRGKNEKRGGAGMTELERRALLGDRQAQEERTRQGILLPCPFCGNKHIRISNWGMWRCWCPECLGKSEDSLRERDAVKHWNTRHATPVGRCGECALKDTFDCICSKKGYTDKIMEYCSFFAPKEGEENG